MQSVHLALFPLPEGITFQAVAVVLPSELPAKPEVLRRISPARASWLVFLPVERLAEYQQVQRERVRGCHPDMEAACTLSD